MGGGKSMSDDPAVMELLWEITDVVCEFMWLLDVFCIFLLSSTASVESDVQVDRTQGGVYKFFK
jgi:hypothetical protein